MNTVVPLVSLKKTHVCDTRDVSFTFSLIPCSEDVPNWSLDQISKPGEEFKKKLGLVLIEQEVTCAFLPGTWQNNARILFPSQFIQTLQVGPVEVRYNPFMPAEGTSLSTRGHGVVISPGGCPIVVMSRGNTVIVAHAGEKSLFDHRALLGGAARRNPTVIGSILAELKALSTATAREVQVWIFYSIDSERYFHPMLHPLYRASNEKLWEELCNKPYFALKDTPRYACAAVENKKLHLNLPTIIAKQCIARGVPWNQVHLEHSILPNNDFSFPTTRAQEEKNRSRRYLILATRN